MKKYFFLSLASCLIFLNSCTTIEDLKRVEPLKSAFEQELFNNYRNFAEQEANQYDLMDSQYFIYKAMRVAYGKNIEPENLNRWKIDEANKQELAQARETLLHIINAPGIKMTHPKDAADFLFYFDCWVEQQEENWQEEDISICKEKFYLTANKLKSIVLGQYQGEKILPTNELNANQIENNHEHTLYNQVEKASKMNDERAYIPSFEIDPPIEK